MIVEQIYTGCLAHGAYYIESDGEAAVIDPLREVEPYLKMATERNAKIKYVFETHFHADFVSGHIDLAKKTGAEIVYGPTEMSMGFDAIVAQDGQEFSLGKVKIRLIHTPGHTMESSCYLLLDENGKETALFTGDTLFIGDVGRPDLAQKVVEELTPEKLAGHLYDSLQNKIMNLPDDVIIYPGHGAGSACGKKMSKETTDTLGNQKKLNYALQSMSKEEFIKELLTGLTPPPGYFPENVKMNVKGYTSFDKVLKRGKQGLSPRAFEAAANETMALVLDTRPPEEFVKGFIPNSINIGLNGSFATWVGTLVKNINQEILIVTEQGKEEETITRMARVGYENVLGYLEGGIEAWIAEGKELDTMESISVNELSELKEQKDIKILDVRRKSEYDSERVIDAVNIPLDYINDNMSQLDKHTTYYVHCAAGYRSVIFNSILRSRGFDNLVNIKGGFSKLKSSQKFPISDYVSPTTML